VAEAALAATLTNRDLAVDVLKQVCLASRMARRYPLVARNGGITPAIAFVIGIVAALVTRVETRLGLPQIMNGLSELEETKALDRLARCLRNSYKG